MAMDAKQRKTLMIRIGAGAVLLLLLAFGGWMLFGPSNTTAPTQSRLGPSDPMAPGNIQPTPEATGTPAAGVKGTLSSNPSTINFQADKPDTVVFTLQAIGGPVAIRSALIPTADADVLKVTNIDCPVVPQQPALEANKACTASVTWMGGRTVNSTLTIAMEEVALPGASVTAPVDGAAPAPSQTLVIPITGVWTKPGGVPQPGQNGQVAPPPTGENAQQNAPQPASGSSMMQMARDAYLAGRRGMGMSVAQAPGGLQPAARSPYTSWDNIGIQAVKSSSPTDMSRVITPDKPMTAVLTYQIDTRQTVTAVATVDRDVYGSSGRTVVIPRGTKIIGRTGNGAVDRVGIAWNQIIRPDGVRFVFQGESGDAMGRGGVPGRINNRYLQRYGYSLLPTLSSAGLTAILGGQASQSSGSFGSSQTMDAKAVAAQILSQPLNQISQDLFSKNQNIPVQITVPAGTRITIWSTGDLRLKPAGEAEDVTSGQQNAQGQQGANPFGAAGGARQGGQQVNPYAQQPQQAATAPAAQTNSTTNGAGTDTSALQVGRVDSNGNYIAPGSTAPAPGPIVTNTNNAAARQTNGGTTTTRTTMPSNSNPWQ